MSCPLLYFQTGLNWAFADVPSLRPGLKCAPRGPTALFGLGGAITYSQKRLILSLTVSSMPPRLASFTPAASRLPPSKSSTPRVYS